LFCPECGAEYQPGFTTCHDCRVALVEGLPEPAVGELVVSEASPSPARPPAAHPPADPAERLDLVIVFRTGDPGMIALVRSLFQAADIPFMTRGEGIQDLTGLGRLGSGYNLAFGPVEFHVRRDDAADARLLLDDLVKDSVESGDPDQARANDD
jgi:hypothetical protein